MQRQGQFCTEYAVRFECSRRKFCYISQAGEGEANRAGLAAFHKEGERRMSAIRWSGPFPNAPSPRYKGPSELR